MFIEVRDPGNGIFVQVVEKIVRSRHYFFDKVQALRDFQSKTRGLALKISLMIRMPKFVRGKNASILIPHAPDRFNLDETSLKHNGRQGLNVFW